MAKGLKAVACLKALRGSMAFAFGASIISLPINKTTFLWNDHPAVTELTTLFETRSNWITHFTDEQIAALSLLAFALGILRWVEAAGIWYNKNWAEWLAVSTGAIYIPFEINQLFQNFSLLVLIILIVNLTVVAYLLFVLKLKRYQPNT